MSDPLEWFQHMPNLIPFALVLLIVPFIVLAESLRGPKFKVGDRIIERYLEAWEIRSAPITEVLEVGRNRYLLKATPLEGLSSQTQSYSRDGTFDRWIKTVDSEFKIDNRSHDKQKEPTK